MSCKGTAPQSVSLAINESKEYHCSLVAPVANNCTVTTEDTDNVNVTINITNALECSAIYGISMSINNTKTTKFTFNINDNTVVHHTASVINPMIKEYNTTLNEANDTIGSVTHPNIAYETIKATGRGTTAGGIQANVAYENIIRGNSVYDIVQEAPTEPTERMYDTINK
uniref:Uncharacterized protein n=1 Tax=Amphimedon queenslandica TaxID=400682 RepID=A0A1X7TQI3_AMPQE